MSYIDRNLKYRFVNKKYLKWLSRPESDFIRKMARDVFGAKIDDATLTYHQNAIRGIPSIIETTFENDELGSRQLLAQYLPDQRSHQTEGVVILVTDITDQKASEQKIKEQARTFAVINQVVLS